MPRSCPSCRTTMQLQSFGRKPLGTLDLDLCFTCRGIWFDQFESLQLAPGAVIELFRLIHDHRDDPSNPVAETCTCPVCRARLQFTNDLQRTNRITYYRCVAGHGRFTTFFQFLREKNFVRSLSAGEIQRLRATVKQVRCSSCGGAIDLSRDTACPYCRAPVSILDPDSVKATLEALDAEERRHAHPDPTAQIDALLAGKAIDRLVKKYDPNPQTQDSLIDLFAESVARIISH